MKVLPNLVVFGVLLVGAFGHVHGQSDRLMVDDPNGGVASRAHDDPALAGDLHALFSAAYPAGDPGAAVIVVRDGRTLYRGAAGMAHLELEVPMRADHVFKLFSVTKQFTGAAILLLAEEGRLSLSDPVTRHLPDLGLGFDGADISLAHLLSHMSGLVNYSDLDAWWAMIHEPVEAATLVDLFREAPPRFEPGTRWEYNNSGYVLLGLVIERISGESYADFVRTRLLEPLGMNDTYVYDRSGAILQGRVEGYTQVDDEWRRAPHFSLLHGFAVGNMLSTVDDLARWNAALTSEEVLPLDAWRTATSPARLADGEDVRFQYAAGHYVARLGPFRTLEHGGNLAGGMTHVLWIPDEKLFIAVLANAQPPPMSAPEDVAIAIATRVLGVSMHPPDMAIPPGRLAEYEGVYRIDEHDTRTISLRGGHLVSTHSRGEPLRLRPIGDDLFEFEGSHTWMWFEREGGRVVAHRIMPRLEPASRLAFKER